MAGSSCNLKKNILIITSCISFRYCLQLLADDFRVKLSSLTKSLEHGFLLKNIKNLLKIFRFKDFASDYTYRIWTMETYEGVH